MSLCHIPWHFPSNSDNLAMKPVQQHQDETRLVIYKVNIAEYLKATLFFPLDCPL